MPVVTTDAELLARLEERIDELSSTAMAEYARSLGLYPPGDVEGINPTVVLQYPADADIDGPGQIVWDMRPDEE